MEQVVIRKYRTGGTLTFPAPGRGVLLTKCEHVVENMSKDVVNMTLTSREPVDIGIGDSIELNGGVYRVNQLPEVTHANTGFTYNIIFESAKYDMHNVMFLLPPETIGNELTGTLHRFAELVVWNMNRVYAPNTDNPVWVLGTCPTDREYTATKDFSQNNCLAVIQSICKDFDYEFRVAESGGVKTLNVLKPTAVFGTPFEYGRNKGLYSVKRQATSSENVITRLYVYGSTENLPASYRHTRLCLRDRAKNESYIEDDLAVYRYGLKEGFRNYDDIKPHRTGKITRRVSSNVYEDSTIDFDLSSIWHDNPDDYAEWLALRGYNDTPEMYALYVTTTVDTSKYLVGDQAVLTFTTGQLAGHDFNISAFVYKEDGQTVGRFTLIPKVYEQGTPNEYTIPNGSMRASRNDQYVLTGIYQPMSYIRAAETALSNQAHDDFANLSQPNAKYEVKLTEMFMRDHGFDTDAEPFVPGDYVRIKDAEIGINKDIKIAGFSHDLIAKEKYTLTISDIKRSVWYERAVRAGVDEAVAQVERPFGYIPPTDVCDCIIVPNFNGDANKLHCSGGTYKHGSATYTITPGTISRLVPTSVYAVLLTVNKSTGVGYLYTDTYQWGDTVMDNNSWLYMQVGTLSSVSTVNGVSARTLTLINGFGRISGNDIVGGSISDNNGHKILDLHTGVVRFKRSNGTFIPVSDVDDEIFNPSTGLRTRTAALETTTRRNAFRFGRFGGVAQWTKDNGLILTQGVYRNDELGITSKPMSFALKTDRYGNPLTDSTEYTIYAQLNAGSKSFEGFVLSADVPQDEGEQMFIPVGDVGGLDNDTRMVTMDICGVLTDPAHVVSLDGDNASDMFAITKDNRDIIGNDDEHGLRGIIGKDTNHGLRKQVGDLSTAVGDENSGLTKRVIVAEGVAQQASQDVASKVSNAQFTALMSQMNARLHDISQTFIAADIRIQSCNGNECQTLPQGGELPNISVQQQAPHA